AADAFCIRAEHILCVLRRLRVMAPVFQMTGATHQAAFTNGPNVLHFEEDIGRHNAVDKVLGRCLMQRTDTRSGALLVTGRVNGEMVLKALRQGVPVVAGRGAATARAVDLARERRLTLVGFARGDRMNIYSAPERIEREVS
ncbi:MAG: formate dehydrogenase accessory sulfurtransferase FdhD, partial [Candidatus Brocadiia bacterium]